MSRDMRKTKIKDWYEFYQLACPVCGKTGGCMQHKDGEMVACIRIESEKYFSKNSSLPSYLHFLKGEKKRRKIDSSKVAEYMGEKKKQDSILNTVYSAMLDCLELDDSHYDHLTSAERNLSDEQIRLRGYRSFPDQPWNIAKDIQDILGVDDLSGIPGFYLGEGKYGQYWSINGMKGILIPFRNHKNEIVGFQYRIDNPPNVATIKERKQGLRAKVIQQPNLVQVSYEGTILFEKELELGKTETISVDSDILGWVTLKKGNRYYWLSSANKKKGTGSGDPAPVHVSVPSEKLKNWKTGEVLKTRTVWLSEGPLKTDISADYIPKLFDPEELVVVGDVLLALPGVNSWRLSLPIMKEMGVEEVNLCFDADVVNNPYVRNHLMECVKELKAEGYHVNMVIWNQNDGKGIDDLFINSKIPHFKKLF
ncbi:DUF3854 domain-containing protein [Bacillus sp. AFS040349]|uniref:DUF3854 domain-containing protein n=1 Tax=Bacillus sp. AFS040349 TaxID=2033502 RepID=UPI00159BD135|nr:DUF3854 domain-containing protein [Bacillus sp. AFS040349]